MKTILTVEYLKLFDELVCSCVDVEKLFNDLNNIIQVYIEYYDANEVYIKHVNKLNVLYNIINRRKSSVIMHLRWMRNSKKSNMSLIKRYAAHMLLFQDDIEFIISEEERKELIEAGDYWRHDHGCEAIDKPMEIIDNEDGEDNKDDIDDILESLKRRPRRKLKLLDDEGKYAWAILKNMTSL